MKVKIKHSGRISEAKRFKDMTEEEQNNSIRNEYIRTLVTDEFIFTKPVSDSKVWSVWSEDEVEILKEEVMDAVEYLKAKARMTEYCGRCNQCGLSGKLNGTESKLGCTYFEFGNAEQAVEVVENWAKENPVKTYLNVLLEKFPNTKLLRKGSPDICVITLFKTQKPCKENHITCTDCWNREYKEEE